jgi:hypothetical protein
VYTYSTIYLCIVVSATFAVIISKVGEEEAVLGNTYIESRLVD